MGCGSSNHGKLVDVQYETVVVNQTVTPPPPQPLPPATKTAETQTSNTQPKLVQNKSSNAKEPNEKTKSQQSVAKSKSQENPQEMATQENKMSSEEKKSPTISKKGKDDSKPVTSGGEKESNIPHSDGSGSKTITNKESQQKNTVESYLPLEPESQRKFDTVVRSACLLAKSDSVLKAVDKHVTRLQLNQALPHTYSLYNLVRSLENLQVLDLSNNSLGPQGFRCLCLALCSNSSLLSLNLAGNRADTDSAECVGRLVSENKSLVYLDISSNSLGKDYFSRCVGPALRTNNTLHTLRAQSIGSTDLRVLLENLPHNSTLTDVDLASNALSNRNSLGQAFSTWIQKPECVLSSLSLASCDMSADSLHLLCDALTLNNSLTQLNLNGNQFGSQNLVFKFIVSSCRAKVTNLHMNDAKVKDQSISHEDIPAFPDSPPSLRVLSLHSSNISDFLFMELRKWTKGRQLPLTDLDITNNTSLTTSCIDDIVSVTSSESGTSSLHRLTYGMNNAESLAKNLNMSHLPCLAYLNLRKGKLSAPGVSDVLSVCLGVESQLTSLNLDGLKLAGTDTIKRLAEKLQGSKVSTLSLGGCSLADSDLSPLCDLIRQGHPLHMLKLSANRITDKGLGGVAKSLVSQKTHPLGVLDLSNNTIGNEGAIELSQLYTNKGHKSSLHSINLTGNIIGKTGVMSLVSVVGGTCPLRTLYVSDQRSPLLEADMEDVFAQVASSLGFKITRTGDEIQANSSDLPSLPEGLLINLSKLGGQPGSLGRLLHSRAIVTDTSQDVLTGLTLSGVLEIVAGLQQLGGECVLSGQVWRHITGAHRDNEVPSWLQLPEHRERGVYLCNLPGNASVQKLEGMLEMEADCSVDEVVLVKDPVSRSNSGVAWVLLSDTESVKKALDFYQQGQAKVFGQPFSISRITVKVDDEKTSELAAKARQDMETRTKARRSEDAAHRALIQQNTEESWKRHAYRLAHPAYADGRIW